MHGAANAQYASAHSAQGGPPPHLPSTPNTTHPPPIPGPANTQKPTKLGRQRQRPGRWLVITHVYDLWGLRPEIEKVTTVEVCVCLMSLDATPVQVQA